MPQDTALVYQDPADLARQRMTKPESIPFGESLCQQPAIEVDKIIPVGESASPPLGARLYPRKVCEDCR